MRLEDQALSLANTFAEYFDSDDDEFVENATKDIVALVQRALEAARKERDVLRDVIEGIRCNTEPNAIASYCDLPEETGPHLREQHLEAMFRAVNAWCRAALSQPVQP